MTDRHLASHWIAWWVGDIFHRYWRGETIFGDSVPTDRMNYCRAKGVVGYDRAMDKLEEVDHEDIERMT